MMKKEDYMRLPKERLAELLAERDAQPIIGPYIQPQYPRPLTCFEGGPCTNPHKDYINCPRMDGGGYKTICTTNTKTTGGDI